MRHTMCGANTHNTPRQTTNSRRTVQSVAICVMPSFMLMMSLRFSLSNSGCYQYTARAADPTDY